MKITPSSSKSPTGLFPIESIGRTEEFETKTRCSRSNKERSQYRVYVADSSSKEEASPTGTPSIIRGTNSDNTDTGDNPPSLSDSVAMGPSIGDYGTPGVPMTATRNVGVKSTQADTPSPIRDKTNSLKERLKKQVEDSPPRSPTDDTNLFDLHSEEYASGSPPFTSEQSEIQADDSTLHAKQGFVTTDRGSGAYNDSLIHDTIAEEQALDTNEPSREDNILDPHHFMDEIERIVRFAETVGRDPHEEVRKAVEDVKRKHTYKNLAIVLIAVTQFCNPNKRNHQAELALEIIAEIANKDGALELISAGELKELQDRKWEYPIMLEKLERIVEVNENLEEEGIRSSRKLSEAEIELIRIKEAHEIETKGHQAEMLRMNSQLLRLNAQLANHKSTIREQERKIHELKANSNELAEVANQAYEELKSRDDEIARLIQEFEAKGATLQSLENTNHRLKNEATTMFREKEGYNPTPSQHDSRHATSNPRHRLQPGPGKGYQGTGSQANRPTSSDSSSPDRRKLETPRNEDFQVTNRNEGSAKTPATNETYFRDSFINFKGDLNKRPEESTKSSFSFGPMNPSRTVGANDHSSPRHGRPRAGSPNDANRGSLKDPSSYHYSEPGHTNVRDDACGQHARDSNRTSNTDASSESHEQTAQDILQTVLNDDTEIVDSHYDRYNSLEFRSKIKGRVTGTPSATSARTPRQSTTVEDLSQQTGEHSQLAKIRALPMEDLERKVSRLRAKLEQINTTNRRSSAGQTLRHTEEELKHQIKMYEEIIKEREELVTEVGYIESLEEDYLANKAKTHRHPSRKKREYHVRMMRRGPTRPTGPHTVFDLPVEHHYKTLREVTTIPGMDESLFDFMMNTFLGVTHYDARIAQSLRQARIAELTMFLSMSKTELARLAITVRTSKSVATGRLAIGDITKINIAHDMINMLVSDNVTYSDFMSLSSDDIDNFRRSGILPLGYKQNGITSPFNTAKLSMEARAEIMTFRKGMKRDKTQFTEFTKGVDFLTWEAAASTTARNQGIAIVMDHDATKTIKTTEDKDMYDLKNTFFYEVLQHTMKEPVAAHIVTNYEDSKDGNGCYQEIRKHFTSDVTTQNLSLSLLQKLSRADITSSRRGYAQFLLKWSQMLKTYERLAGEVTENNKLAWLQGICSGVADLDAIRTKAMMDLTTGAIPKKLTHKQHFNLVCHEAQLLDQRQQSEARAKKVNKALMRRACKMGIDIFDEGYDDLVEDELDYESDDSHPEYDINETRSKFRRPSVDRTTWDALPPEDQALWDKLSAKARFSILNYGRKRGQGRNAKSNPTKVKFMDTTDGEKENDPPSADENEDRTELSINKTTKSPHPGDPRRLLSQPNPKRKVKMARFSTTRSNQAKETSSAMIDRGANGGLAGKDVNIISVSDDEIDVTGIDSYQMGNIQIGTVGGVTFTHKGPAILIFNQYGITESEHSIHSSIQMENYGVEVYDTAIENGGHQCLIKDGYVIPIDIKAGLPHIRMRKFTDKEFRTLPHIVMTSNMNWSPNTLDSTMTRDRKWCKRIASSLNRKGNDPRFTKIIDELTFDGGSSDLLSRKVVALSKKDEGYNHTKNQGCTIQEGGLHIPRNKYKCTVNNYPERTHYHASKQLPKANRRPIIPRPKHTVLSTRRNPTATGDGTVSTDESSNSQDQESLTSEPEYGPVGRQVNTGTNARLARLRVRRERIALTHEDDEPMDSDSNEDDSHDLLADPTECPTLHDLTSITDDNRAGFLINFKTEGYSLKPNGEETIFGTFIDRRQAYTEVFENYCDTYLEKCRRESRSVDQLITELTEGKPITIQRAIVLGENHVIFQEDHATLGICPRCLGTGEQGFYCRGCRIMEPNRSTPIFAGLRYFVLRGGGAQDPYPYIVDPLELAHFLGRDIWRNHLNIVDFKGGDMPSEYRSLARATTRTQFIRIVMEELMDGSQVDPTTVGREQWIRLLKPTHPEHMSEEAWSEEQELSFLDLDISEAMALFRDRPRLRDEAGKPRGRQVRDASTLEDDTEFWVNNGYQVRMLKRRQEIPRNRQETLHQLSENETLNDTMRRMVCANWEERGHDLCYQICTDYQESDLAYTVMETTYGAIGYELLRFRLIHDTGFEFYKDDIFLGNCPKCFSAGPLGLTCRPCYEDQSIESSTPHRYRRTFIQHKITKSGENVKQCLDAQNLANVMESPIWWNFSTTNDKARGDHLMTNLEAFSSGFVCSRKFLMREIIKRNHGYDKIRRINIEIILNPDYAKAGGREAEEYTQLITNEWEQLKGLYKEGSFLPDDVDDDLTMKSPREYKVCVLKQVWYKKGVGQEQNHYSGFLLDTNVLPNGEQHCIIQDGQSGGTIRRLRGRIQHFPRDNDEYYGNIPELIHHSDWQDTMSTELDHLRLEHVFVDDCVFTTSEAPTTSFSIKTWPYLLTDQQVGNLQMYLNQSLITWKSSRQGYAMMNDSNSLGRHSSDDSSYLGRGVKNSGVNQPNSGVPSTQDPPDYDVMSRGRPRDYLGHSTILNNCEWGIHSRTEGGKEERGKKRSFEALTSCDGSET